MKLFLLVYYKKHEDRKEMNFLLNFSFGNVLNFKATGSNLPDWHDHQSGVCTTQLAPREMTRYAPPQIAMTDEQLGSKLNRSKLINGDMLYNPNYQFDEDFILESGFRH
jgi:hypothetical protein